MFSADDNGRFARKIASVSAATMLVSLALIALMAFSPLVVSDTAPEVTVVDSFTQLRTRDGRIDLPYFDVQNQLRWNGELVTDAGKCSVDWFPGVTLREARCSRTTLMLNPRVDECRCSGKTSMGVGTAISYAGLDATSKERWRRYSHAPDSHSGRRLSGADPDGLVFDNLEVWSPDTGETIRPADASHRSFDTTYYLPGRNAYLKFDAEVTLLHSEGGLYLQVPNGGLELVLHVETKLFGYYRVESVAPVAGTSLILLGERYSTRGPGSARFELFDLATRKVLFRDERSEDHYIASVKVIAGADGHVAFSYLDETQGEHQVVHYRID